ncbi:pilus assembly protein TadG-related protein [Streptomyces polyrhachis]|uniref:Pilus assembly protein TadG-related protein n=1 Tax=Streptomyces polyrhachis TaxID=1282885 RepID=A0ABW2G945_9ACTN
MRKDEGQAFPIYLTAVGGLLFLAFVFFAVAQSAVGKNKDQGAADAAALAAAQDARRGLHLGWINNITRAEQWDHYLNARSPESGCARASEFAAENDSRVTACERVFWPTGIRVETLADKRVGDSLVPGTENAPVKSAATAVIEPRCSFVPIPAPIGATGAPRVLPLMQLVCHGVPWPPIDLEILATMPPEAVRALLPSAEDLFSVHLKD